MTENIARGSIKARRVDVVKLIAMNHKTLRIVSVLECILGSILVSIRPDASPTPAAKATANAKAKPESIVYTRTSSAKNMGDGGAAPTPKERGQAREYSLGHPLAMHEARGYPLASTGDGANCNGSEPRKETSKSSETKQGKGKGRSKSKGKNKVSESKQLALCQGFADDNDITILQTTTTPRAKVLTQHRSQMPVIAATGLTGTPMTNGYPPTRGYLLLLLLLLPLPLLM